MPSITKDGQPKPNSQDAKARRQAAAKRARERKEQEERKADLAEHGIKVAHPMNVNVKRQADHRRAIASANDPTLLHMVEFVLGKAVLGYTPRQISMIAEDELGYPLTQGKIKRVIDAEMAKRKAPLIAEIRKRSDMLIDRLMTKLETKVDEGDVQAIHEVRLLDESRRKLFGADMPANVRVTGEIEHKLDPAVTAMIEESKARIRAEQENARTHQLEDPAIIDAEVVDEEPDYKAGEYQEYLPDDDDEEVEVEDL
jgi:hypothetical protein